MRSSPRYRCSRCQQDKPASDFHQRRDARKTRPVYPYCKPCRAQHDQQRHRQHRNLLWQEKARRGGCQDCGRVDHPYLMDFDHRPGEVKCFEISDSGSRKNAMLQEELAKCDLVCVRCHRIRTWNRERPEDRIVPAKRTGHPNERMRYYPHDNDDENASHMDRVLGPPRLSGAAAVRRDLVTEHPLPDTDSLYVAHLSCNPRAVGAGAIPPDGTVNDRRDTMTTTEGTR